MDMLHEIFAKLDVEITLKPLPWARAVSQMKTGDIDMIPVIFRTPEREGFMALTLAYAEVPTSVFTARGSSFDYRKLEDLLGRSGVKMRRDSISEDFEAIRHRLELTEVATYEQMFRMLGSGRADYAVAAGYGFLIEARKLRFHEEIEQLPVPIATRSLHLAFSKLSPFVKHLPLADEKIRQMKKTGYLDRMIRSALEQAAGP